MFHEHAELRERQEEINTLFADGANVNAASVDDLEAELAALSMEPGEQAVAAEQQQPARVSAASPSPVAVPTEDSQSQRPATTAPAPKKQLVFE